MPVFWIGVRRYPTKGAAEEAIRGVLSRYEVGDVVNQEADDLLLRDLLDMHPEADAKIGSGVDCFRVMRTPRGNYKGFLVVRTDGSSIDFSYQSCLKPPTHEQRVKAAMRTEVRPQVNAFFELRKSAGTLVSDQSGTPLATDGTHVAYFRGPSFLDIAVQFADAAGGWDVFQLTPTTEPGLAVFADSGLAARWHAFHREHAILGLLSAAENRRRPRG
ncbi:DCL family protein [Sphaerisporangium sp. NPDC049003]|uniref:DCL family protein n=1 Tax=Sphaerisporangium sp. NPDC049003 TaxID=3364517 RepID=UPI00371313CF